MKTNIFKQFIRKLCDKPINHEFSAKEYLNAIQLKNIQNAFNCSLKDLSIWFPKNKIGLIEENRSISVMNFDCISIINANLTIGEHEQQKIYKILIDAGYSMPKNYNQENIILDNQEAKKVLLSIGRCQYAMGDNKFSQYFDANFWFGTNDEKLIISLQNQIFEMSPPWLVFDDYVFAYRNHYWRADWKNFWNRLSEEEKQTYFIKYDAPKDWIGWLSAEEFELS